MENTILKTGNGNTSKNYNIPYYVGLLFLGIALGYLTGYSNINAIAITVFLVLMLFIAKSPLKALSLFIIIAPFSKTIYLRESLYNTQGFKIMQLLAIIIIVISIINYSKSVKMPRVYLFFLLAIIAIFTVSILRSLKYLELFNTYYFTDDKLTEARYVLSHYIKPIICVLPFIIILKYVTTEKELKYVMDIVYIAIILLSIHLLFNYLFDMKNRFDIDYVSDYYAKAYGMHRNEIASYYIIGLPIAIERFISNKKIYNIIFILLILSAIGIVFSRGAYLSTMIAILGYLVISKRLKLFPVITIIIIAIPLIIYTPVLTRASQGIKTKDRDAISAGRIDDIWLPLIKEYAKSPKKMIFGSGRYAIHSSNAASKGEILQDISHPHNMFLEIIIDAGLIGFTVIALFYFRVIYKAFRTLSIMKDDRLKAYLYANIISIICFLISGFTDRSFFPKDDTMFIWVILACAIVNCTIAENIVSIQHQVNVSTNSKA